MGRRNPIRNARRGDLLLGAGDARGHGRFGHQIRAGDLRGGQTTEQAQRQRDLRLLRQRRVAAREDEPQPIIAHRAHVLRLPLRFRESTCFARQLVASPVSPQLVDTAVSGRRGDPGTRVGWNAVLRPSGDGYLECLLHGVLGDVDTAEVADQRRHGTAVLRAEDAADLVVRHGSMVPLWCRGFCGTPRTAEANIDSTPVQSICGRRHVEVRGVCEHFRRTHARRVRESCTRRAYFSNLYQIYLPGAVGDRSDLHAIPRKWPAVLRLGSPAARLAIITNRTQRKPACSHQNDRGCAKLRHDVGPAAADRPRQGFQAIG
ncbi:Uncharacterised protein [Mycobacteroides abscessus subsp. abscessus]|nr:Uncharacterised protein [Mycobacteroides abscessus subsp. abscessus]